MKIKSSKITVVGLGYVGTSMSVLLSRHHEVTVLDIDEKKINNINNRISPIDDKEIQKELARKKLNLKGTLDNIEAFKDADFIVICTPTNFDEHSNYFDLSSIESTIQEALKYNQKAAFIIKSTVSIGCTSNLIKKFDYDDIYFSPEFLREGRALYDNFYPSRIIIGSSTTRSRKFLNILKHAAKTSVKQLAMSSDEAEAVKLFANSYLALRVAYFNELDNFAISNKLDSKSIIEGISYDPRIGNYYNNPSFGYGGYCLPKDTKQLLANYKGIPNSIISSIVDSNAIRKKFLTEEILKCKPTVIGIYGLAMKSGSDNFRSSAIIDLMHSLSKNTKIIVHEPLLGREKKLNNFPVINNFKKFISDVDLVITNRIDSKLTPYKHKVFSRDIFRTD